MLVFSDYAVNICMDDLLANLKLFDFMCFLFELGNILRNPVYKFQR